MIYIGLLLIVVGWLFQYFSNSRDLQKSFLAIYILGAFLLTLDAFLQRFILLGIMNFATVVVVFLILRKGKIHGRR